MYTFLIRLNVIGIGNLFNVISHITITVIIIIIIIVLIRDKYILVKMYTCLNITETNQT